jgi:hypothetical protein
VPNPVEVKLARRGLTATRAGFDCQLARSAKEETVSHTSGIRPALVNRHALVPRDLTFVLAGSAAGWPGLDLRRFRHLHAVGHHPGPSRGIRSVEGRCRRAGGQADRRRHYRRLGGGPGRARARAGGLRAGLFHFSGLLHSRRPPPGSARCASSPASVWVAPGPVAPLRWPKPGHQSIAARAVR